MTNISQLTSSFYIDKLQVYVDHDILKVVALPKILKDHRILIKIVNESGKEFYGHNCEVTLPLTIRLNKFEDGEYYLQFYYQSTSDSNYYIGLNASKGLTLYISKGEIVIKPPVNFENNKRFFEKLKSDYFQKLAYMAPTTIYHSTKPEIVDYARRITKYSHTSYQKILAIHDWVADNLFYDMDSLMDGSYAFKKYEPLTLLATRRTICRGYSKLAVTLLRAIGIPAFDVLCVADGEGECQEDEANHVITFALDRNRWIIMDPTWDSVNIYKNGKFSKKTAVNVMHQYFDTTIAFISYTHRFIK